jgi:hypothetical protein
MSGSLDDFHITVLGSDDYHYLVIRDTKLTVRISPTSKITNDQVISDLQQVIRSLERDPHG